MTESQANVVEAVQEAVFPEGVDLKGGVEALVVGDGLGLEVDGEFVLWVCGAAREEGLHVLFAEADEDDAVLAGVREEDVRKAGRDDGEEAVLGYSPSCMFSR